MTSEKVASRPIWHRDPRLKPNYGKRKSMLPPTSMGQVLLHDNTYEDRRLATETRLINKQQNWTRRLWNCNRKSFIVRQMIQQHFMETYGYNGDQARKLLPEAVIRLHRRHAEMEVRAMRYTGGKHLPIGYRLNPLELIKRNKTMDIFIDKDDDNGTGVISRKATGKSNGPIAAEKPNYYKEDTVVDFNNFGIEITDTEELDSQTQKPTRFINIFIDEDAGVSCDDGLLPPLPDNAFKSASMHEPWDTQKSENQPPISPSDQYQSKSAREPTVLPILITPREDNIKHSATHVKRQSIGIKSQHTDSKIRLTTTKAVNKRRQQRKSESDANPNEINQTSTTTDPRFIALKRSLSSSDTGSKPKATTRGELVPIDGYAMLSASNSARSNLTSSQKKLIRKNYLPNVKGQMSPERIQNALAVANAVQNSEY